MTAPPSCLIVVDTKCTYLFAVLNLVIVELTVIESYCTVALVLITDSTDLIISGCSIRKTGILELLEVAESFGRMVQAI
jgi:hypothetical protein